MRVHSLGCEFCVVACPPLQSLQGQFRGPKAPLHSRAWLWVSSHCLRRCSSARSHRQRGAGMTVHLQGWPRPKAFAPQGCCFLGCPLSPASARPQPHLLPHSQDSFLSVTKSQSTPHPPTHTLQASSEFLSSMTYLLEKR